MLGSKLRSWMEAVRPRKKQQRKEKQTKLNQIISSTVSQNSQNNYNPNLHHEENLNHKPAQTVNYQVTHTPRYSGANLSSPESAYSTGYSTDGTSPGAPPPEYYINIRTGTRYFSSALKEPKNFAEVNGTSDSATSCTSTCLSEIPQCPTESIGGSTPSRSHLSPAHVGVEKEKENLSTIAVHVNGDLTTVSIAQDYDKNSGFPLRINSVKQHKNFNHPNNISASVVSRFTDVVNSGLTSPRQRNRIRTNPWLPGNNLSPGSSTGVLHVRQDSIISTQALINNPVSAEHLSPILNSCLKKNISRYSSSLSSSSSSCSSLSENNLHWDPSIIRHNQRINSASDEEDDCTLNEMMGKYDESYVYEKETDILSDSDPTDCETDVDTGQDGGDEEDPLDREFDFIDNGSYLEFNGDGKDERNTGHCTYHNFEMQRRMSRRRTTRRSHKQDQIIKQTSDKRKRSVSSKKKSKYIETSKKIATTQLINYMQIDGSRSAGATPLSVRRTKQSISKLALEDRFKKRSNSLSSSCRDPVSAFDKNDKEADKKYKELIVEAEHILMTMKNNSFSPRRLPGPANKRVELLRSTESTKADIYLKNRLIDDVANVHLTRVPSNNFNSPRFSPKRNHITNFINNNSPLTARREVTFETTQGPTTPLFLHKEKLNKSQQLNKKNTRTEQSARSPQFRKKLGKTLSPKRTKEHNYSSDSENEIVPKSYLSTKKNLTNGFSCPQSEPVKRKVYFDQDRPAQFNFYYENINDAQRVNTMFGECENRSGENLRQQVLLNTIVNLKRSLEDQSASLKQVYSSSQNLDV